MAKLYVGLVLALATALSLRAQQPATTAQTSAQVLDGGYDAATVERGQRLLVAECGFCHGSTARGGSGGPDLTRSVLVLDDENGKQLGEFLRAGRPDKGMPKFDLTAAQVSDVATYLHYTVHFAASRRLYKIQDILVGDAKKGEAFFYGVGKCGSCHSTQLDLRGVGAKYDAATLQTRMLMPRGGGTGPAYLEKNAIKVTVKPSAGESVLGSLVRLTDFEVTLYDPSSMRIRSWLRNGDVPKVDVADPLQAHMDQLLKWTDADMHDMTAYLASLK